MPKVRKLSKSEIDERLVVLSGWELDSEKLFKEYKFKNFVAAFDFMTRVAEVAETSAHHPEWFNVYGTVRVHLTTHEVGGISDRDFNLAERMDELADA